MNIKRNVSVIVAVAALSGMACVAVAPAAFAADAAGTVTSSRSFPKAQVVRKDLLAEATSTSVNDDANWGSTENLDVPQTQSQAEKDAAAAKAAEEQAAKEAAEAAAQAAQEAAAAQAAAASRSSERESISNDSSSQSTSSSDSSTSTGEAAGSAASTSAVTSASAEALVSYATQFVGAPYAAGGNTPSGWDCSGFVQYVFAQFGISLPRSSGAQATVGTAVASIAEAQPGDILANGTHAAIYIGNGLVVNALNPYQGTQITGLGVFTSGYSIRRVL
ncbi:MULTISPECIES: C40 family peptidase [Bifidobacterium]|uniref:C40 family peptidase n=1 Tax=Bifidobacterium TaxID=1678 RepID=UPI001BDD1E01|nr:MULTISPECIES: C40 family peptidase [Bifidobacterium]MBT1160432.1 C40 family peptidase [Bifidobacterium sp. SO1]MBW3079567.1 C40 family peptidase [Bifidobacterium simiiventris]